MARTAKLVFSPTISGSGSGGRPPLLLAESENGIPLGWLFCFGGRNFWEPDQTVMDRGGASADRNRFETPLEVAEARLAHAISGMQHCAHLWVWLGAIDVLHRRLLARGKKGFLRMEADWALGNPKDREELVRLISYCENVVNRVSADQPGEASLLLPYFDRFCQWVPKCREGDAKSFEKAKGYADLAAAHRAAALLIGLPPDNRERFFRLVESRFQPVFETLGSLPPYPKPEAPPGKSKPPAPRGDRLSLGSRLRSVLRRG